MAEDIFDTGWLERLRGNDSAAEGVLFRTYFERLVQLARQHLAATVRRAADEEDVALSALNSFFRGLASNRFPDLHDRTDLWRILLTITLCKARSLARHEQRQRRGGGQVTREADLVTSEGQPEARLDALISSEPPPDLVACFAEQVRHLMEQLPGDDLRAVARARLEGDSVSETAERLSLSQRAVERKLRLIRQYWQPEAS